MNATERTAEQEVARLQAEIERVSNWLIQGRTGDADYLRGYRDGLVRQRDALREGLPPPEQSSIRGRVHTGGGW